MFADDSEKKGFLDKEINKSDKVLPKTYGHTTGDDGSSSKKKKLYGGIIVGIIVLVLVIVLIAKGGGDDGGGDGPGPSPFSGNPYMVDTDSIVKGTSKISGIL